MLKRPLTEEEKRQPEIQSALKDVGELDDILVFINSNGGKEVVSALRKDIQSGFLNILKKHGEYNETKLHSELSDIENKLSILRVLFRAGKNKQEIERFIEDTLA